MAETERIGLGRARRDDGRRPVEAEGRAQSGVLEEAARKAGPLACRHLIQQFARTALACCEVDGLAGREATGQREFADQIAQAVDRLKTQAIDLCGSGKAVERREFGQSEIDLPLQHRGRGRRAAKTFALAVDQDDIAAHRREVLGGQRARDAAADDRDIAARIRFKLSSHGALQKRAPGPRAGAQIILARGLGIEHHSALAGPTRSAIVAPRWPSGFGRPVVVSCSVWCSSSALSSAPASTIVAESQSQVMNTTTVASEP